MSDVRKYLPLSPQQFHILLALTDGHRHGYGIIRDIADRTGGALRVGTGTLYTALGRLDALGFVEESTKRPRAADDDERRRYYRITPLGTATAKEEARRLTQLVRMARAKGFAPGRA